MAVAAMILPIRYRMREPPGWSPHAILAEPPGAATFITGTCMLRMLRSGPLKISDACITTLSTRGDSRRRRSAKARNRGR
jgi:hypothetical protein